MPNVLSPRDLVFRPDNMDETVTHNYHIGTVRNKLHDYCGLKSISRTQPRPQILEWFNTYMSLVVRKPVFGVSDQVRHNPGCKTTEDS